jgi:hypothetical protein
MFRSLTTISIRMRSVQVQQRSYEYEKSSWNYCMSGHNIRYFVSPVIILVMRAERPILLRFLNVLNKFKCPTGYIFD